MVLVATLACLLGIQDIRLEPSEPVVGAPVAVHVMRAGEPVVDVEVTVEAPGGPVERVGRTGADGVVGYTPSEAGAHAFVATVDGVRCVAAVAVAPVRRRWWLALGSVPLGLALLWGHLRALGPPAGRRGAAPQARTRST